MDLPTPIVWTIVIVGGVWATIALTSLILFIALGRKFWKGF